MTDRRSQRSHVSYIDATRDYYAAAGYDTPYEWASHPDAPFAPLPRPLSDCRVGVVTTSYVPEAERTRFFNRPDHTIALPLDRANELQNQALQWDQDATSTDDVGTFLPIDRLDEAAAAGRVASLSPRFYGVPTRYSQRRTRDVDAPEIRAAMDADDVDVAVLVPL